MIEVIYKGNDEDKKEEHNISLPKNVRQIGECLRENYKIYMEDFAMTYVKHFGGRNLKYGVLLGNTKSGNGNIYIFIKGAVCAKPVLDNEIIFDEDVWTGIYEDIKMYFEDVEIVGWFISIPGVLENDMAEIQKIHIDNFAGSDKVCFLVDYMEGEDYFLRYGDGSMAEISGHYIYYEKNEDMQSYMIIKREDDTILPSDYEQYKKKGITTKVHRIFFNEENVKKDSNEENKQKEYEKIVTGEKIAEIKKKKFPGFAYSVSSFMILAMLLGTIALMNTSGEIKELKSVVAVVKETEETKAQRVKITSVAGNVFPTTEANNETTNNKATNNEATNNEATNNETTNNETETTALNEVVEETKAPEATITSIADDVNNNFNYYVVEKGDSLYSISMKNYGNTNMIEEIKERNNISDENYISEGETILLP